VSRYTKTLTDAGIEVRTVSRLLNGVSISADMSELEWLDGQDFVREIRPVLLFKRKALSPEPEPAMPKLAPPGTWLLDYGPSEGQLNLIKVPPLHEIGVTGSGIMIGVFDTGFKTDLPAIAAMDVEATYDFINDDVDVSDDDTFQEDHGTLVLTTAGAAVPGQLYGPAYGATYVLAKTEDRTDEYRQEEDFFIAALEWADSIGCDVVTASLGYSDWYTFADMDGNTAPITVACDLAVESGITVISSAGNARSTSWGHISAPADGDSVIAVGAVRPDSIFASFSSPGPTADGQIKPDICTQGTSVTAATTSGGFTNNFSGTSAAAPLAAGGIALILEMHPSWGPIEVRQSIWVTGQHRQGLAYPNNDYGYGILDAEAASAIDLPAGLVISPTSLHFEATENDTNPGPLAIEITADGSDPLEWTASSSTHWLTAEPSSGTTPETVIASVDISQLGGGIYLDTIVVESASARNSPQFVAVRLDVAFEPDELPDEIVAYPNPFSVRVRFRLPSVTTGRESFYVFTVDGSKIYGESLPPGVTLCSWEGMNEDRKEVAAGMYLVKFAGIGDGTVLKVLKAE
jgi:hypothetical protein